jgi:hypothetical protein
VIEDLAQRQSISGPFSFWKQKSGGIVKTTGPINVLFAAMVSAAIYGAVAAVSIPAISFFLLASSNGPGDLMTERGMVVAVIAPAGCGAAGFLLGALMASIANLLVAPARPRIVEEPERAAEALSASAVA